MLLNKRPIYLLLVIFSILFFSRGLFEGLGYSLFNNLLIALALMFSILFLHLFFKVEIKNIVVWFYWIYVVFIGMMAPWLHEHGSYINAIVGYAALWLFLPIFYCFIKTSGEEGLIKILLLIGVVNALGTLIQAFVDPTLFGFANHGVYSNPEVFERDNVTKRAISFISSPQSLSLCLAFTLGILVNTKYFEFWINTVFIIIVFVAGLLTISKAFFVYLIVYFIFTLRISRMLPIVTVVLFVLICFSDFFVRIIEMIAVAEDIKSYSAFKYWYSALIFPKGYLEIIFGSGLGLLSRGGQSLGDYTLLGGSTESFLLQLYVEIGITGLLLFLLVNVLGVIRSRASKAYTASIFAFLSVGLFTPAMYGLSTGFFYYAILSIVLFGRGRS